VPVLANHSNVHDREKVRANGDATAEILVLARKKASSIRFNTKRQGRERNFRGGKQEKGQEKDEKVKKDT
jgi:hypothetical protein